MLVMSLPFLVVMHACDWTWDDDRIDRTVPKVLLVLPVSVGLAVPSYGITFVGCVSCELLPSH